LYRKYQAKGDEVAPNDVIAGHDWQLERAVREALRMLKEKPGTPTKRGASSADVGAAQVPFDLIVLSVLAIGGQRRLRVI
jgi:hypothetical protein